MLHFLHIVGSFSLFAGILSQLIVIAGGWKRGKTPEIVQAGTLLLALGLDSAAIMLRPNQPPQILPDLLGCGAALLLLAPALEAGRKLWAAKEDAKK